MGGSTSIYMYIVCCEFVVRAAVDQSVAVAAAMSVASPPSPKHLAEGGDGPEARLDRGGEGNFDAHIKRTHSKAVSYMHTC